MPQDLSAALDAYAASAEKMTRPQAIRTILADWLRTHGFMKHQDHPQPQGPATDAVREMDEAIKTNRRKT